MLLIMIAYYDYSRTERKGSVDTSPRQRHRPPARITGHGPVLCTSKASVVSRIVGAIYLSEGAPSPRLFPALSGDVDIGLVPASPRLLYVWQQRPCAVAILRSTPPLQPVTGSTEPQQRCRRQATTLNNAGEDQ
ncbi:hypothetical protein JOQ06_029852 [Pogonophryne albipinna]|uniref:Uncharacterized protein n=1 Tax=Pogonophryne albipinna TaxID=1090488 RepID=A0AAD6FFB7_9TELE|nr:hypothetical protein JOQ06_029852 [Pogonophryne albipinna]